MSKLTIFTVMLQPLSAAEQHQLETQAGDISKAGAQADNVLAQNFDRLLDTFVVPHDPGTNDYSARLRAWAKGTFSRTLVVGKLLLAIGTRSDAGGPLGCAGMWRNASTMKFKRNGKDYLAALDPNNEELYVMDVTGSTPLPKPLPDPLPGVMKIDVKMAGVSLDTLRQLFATKLS
jgi:hypothetical protein